MQILHTALIVLNEQDFVTVLFILFIVNTADQVIAKYFSLVYYLQPNKKYYGSLHR